MLFGVPRETIMEEVHALAKRYVDEFAALPLPGVAGDASTPVLETTVALLTQEDLNQAAAATDGATESARTSPSTAVSAPDSLAGGETAYFVAILPTWNMATERRGLGVETYVK
jgi:hypothetical protein